MESEVMTTAIRNRVPGTFEGLNRLRPLYVIRSEREYARARKMAIELAMNSDDLAPGQLRYLETLSVLMETYEREHHLKEERPASPLEVLKLLMAEHDMNGSDLGRLLGHRQLGGAILRGERGLTKTHIATLAGYFGVNVFIDVRPRRSANRSSHRPVVVIPR
jgi:antitoxin component HigA of HigAB toxin-antitoxin module